MKTVKYNKGKGISKVGFIFACPGQKEQAANKVVAGSTGKSLNTLLSILKESNDECIRSLFPSDDRYDYLITNASELIHYPAYDGTSLPKRSEYKTPENLTRISGEVDSLEYVIAFGQQAKEVSDLVSELRKEQGSHKPVFITSLPHLSLLAINQIREDVSGSRIEKGDANATYKRLQVVARKAEERLKLSTMTNELA